MKRTLITICLGLLLSAARLCAQDSAYQDLMHYSKVFGHDKFYRLYLPEGYGGGTKRYPVIYFFHGWGGRHFKDDNALLEYTKLKKVVDQYKVILVMWDGNIDLSEPRPYNVGNHEDVKFKVQMKDYFPELVGHIDSSLRTLTDRQHRGIIGFSMGGFMSLFLSGKYPDKVCAAVSLAGSPEFFVGWPDNQELYPMRYTFENLRQVRTRMHNGNTDILYYLNSEVHAGALWDEQVRLQYWTFDGGHMVDKKGETQVFEKAVRFVTEGMGGPVALPESWSHYDLYPDFSLWNYTVQSDKQEPGFQYLRNVDKKGFGYSTRRWLPDGPALGNVRATVTTAPVYAPGAVYGMVRYDRATGTVQTGKLSANVNGAITVRCDGGGSETGIFKEGDNPEFVWLDHSSDVGGRFLIPGVMNRLRVRLFNRGGEIRQAAVVRVKLYSRDGGVRLQDSVVTLKVLPGQRVLELPAFGLSCSKTPPLHAEPSEVRFHLSVGSGSATFSDEFIIPVYFNAPAFDSVGVDDGRAWRERAIGTGNGDGIVSPGEKVLLYQGQHRLRLYTQDSFVVSGEERLSDEMIPARWPDGFTFSSIVQISPDCPDGHVIEFLGHYETKAFNPIERSLTWGKVRLVVSNKKTAGLLRSGRYVAAGPHADMVETPSDMVEPGAGLAEPSAGFLEVSAGPGDGMPAIVKTKDGAYRLMVDGKPFIALGAQLWNSSSWPYILEKEWPQLKELHANTLEAPVYWQNIEPQPGRFNFSELDSLVLGARRQGIRLVLLWFGSYKNGSSQYAPEWVLSHPEKYPRMMNAGGEEIQVLSAVAAINREADKAAFSALMRHVRELDSRQHTVIMVQVENEAGSLGTDRDYSPAANAVFAGNVPALLLPLAAQAGPASGVGAGSGGPGAAGGKRTGSWAEVFGVQAAETFSAYHIATYVNEVAAAGQAIYNLPMYTNCWLKEHGFRRPGEYPSGGPVSTMIPVWKAAAPALAFLAPDIYHSNYTVFTDLCGKYARPDNAMFVPETGKGTDFARFQFYALANYNALGVAVYGIDPFHADPGDQRDRDKLDDKFQLMADNYRLLEGVTGKIAELQGTGRLAAVGEEYGRTEQLVTLGGYDILCSFGYPTYRKKTMTGRAIIAQLGEDEFLITGFDTRFQFRPQYGAGYSTAEYLIIEEGSYVDGQWMRKRIWNGDEAYHSTLTPDGVTLRIRLRKTRKTNSGPIKANFE